MGTVPSAVTDFEENSLQDQNKRLEVHEGQPEGQQNRLDIPNSNLEDDIRELKSEVSSSGTLGQAIAQPVALEQGFKSVEDQITKLQDQNKELQNQDNKVQDQNKELENQIIELKDQTKKVQEQNKGLEDRIRNLEEQSMELIEQIKKVEDQKKRLEERTSKLEQQNNGLEDQARKLKYLNGRLEVQVKRLKDDIQELKTRSSDSGTLGQVIAQLTSVSFEQGFKSVEDQITKLQDQNKGPQNQDNKVQDQNKELENQIIELKDQTKKLQEQNKGFENRIRNLEEQSKELIDQIKKVEDQKKRLEERTTKLEQQNNGLEDQARKLKYLNGRLEVQVKGLKDDIQELKTRSSDSVKGQTGDVVTSPRASRTSGGDVLFVMGGDYNVDTVETLDPTVGRWVSHKIPDAPSFWTWIGSVGHKVLVLETSNGRFRSLDVTTMEWTQLQYLPQYRVGYTVASSGDQVYVLGGDKPYDTRSDRYDARIDSWGETAPMRQGRELAASVCHAGKIYCSGGMSMPGERYLSTLEVLDPWGNGHWASLPRMRMRRSDHCLVSCGRFLWAIGGWDDKTSLSDVERYDVEGKQWSRVRSIDTPRYAFSASVVGGRVHVIGGETGDTPVRTVEVYDEEQDRWTRAAPLHKERCYHGSCVVSSLPHADADKLTVSSSHLTPVSYRGTSGRTLLPFLPVPEL